MKNELKLLIRSVSSYVMIYSGILIVFWFVFVIVTSLIGLNIYSSDSMDLMVFVLFLGISVIGVAAAINVTLSLDLIAESKINQMNHPNPRLGKRWFGWVLGGFGIFVVVAWISNYIIRTNHLKDFKAITTEVVQSHQGSLEKIVDYMKDSAQILKTKEVLLAIAKSSDQVFQPELIFTQEVNGKKVWVEINIGSDSVALVNLAFEQLVIVPLGEEKKLIQELAYGNKKDAQVLELEKGETKGYYPISKNGKVMVVRLSAKSRFNGNRG
ncbi:hypothetical protein [Algoriphagus sanaruensis]|uniref:Uncharacterized protein n=1 Tax=Algoriphagus sanaruensis TaxID=1727163 RepID=A0A142EPM0_9BACT|nr:hypothetical protein [Algoriphagus sanaruensis]AMQ57075.1 hypothetical protein AO498_11565 [Algoriphagus sanaruensis]